MNDDGWRKSSKSGNQGNDCVEARIRRGQFQVRDSKLGEDSPILDLKSTDFVALLGATAR